MTAEWTPKKLTVAQIIFPTFITDMMPPYADIPDEFKELNRRNFWQKLQSKWFSAGLGQSQLLKAKEGIDRQDAIAHLEYIQGSWEPKHEHKSAGVAYLFSLWFELPAAEEQKLLLDIE